MKRNILLTNMGGMRNASKCENSECEQEHSDFYGEEKALSRRLKIKNRFRTPVKTSNGLSKTRLALARDIRAKKGII
jgi:hypothetical protein